MQYREFKKKSVAFRKKKTMKGTLSFVSKKLSSSKHFFSWKNLLKIFGVLLILWVLGFAVLWAFFLRGVPDINSLERGDYFRESTVIYDKDKNPIYTLFNDGKRTYIPFSDISQSIKDAIVSTEDKTFYENPGVDLMGIVRAFGRYALWNTNDIKGTSTISQQLIKNTLLTNERSIKRKAQEAYLSYKLNKTYSKEKILEMYLNTISFGYNANGIEEASRAYFWKSAKDVGPLGASILASLPKGPTFYSPYAHRDRLMGFLSVYPVADSTEKTTLDDITKVQYKPLYDEFKSYLSGMTIEGDINTVKICGVKKEYTRDSSFSPDSNGCIKTNHDDLMNFFGDIIIKKNITSSGWTDMYALEYTIGRKDFVAGRMFAEGKIDGPTFKKVVFDGLEFQFNRYTENIKYPYFVMYIKEYLESKYGKDIDITQWLKVYTTLDPVLQTKAEELVKKQVAINKAQYWASSAAIVSMDNVTGKLLVMVGGPDYNDTENGGNNNMATATTLQPGSSFKPFVYGLAISKNPIWPESPIADVQTTFSNWTPPNYDNKFLGIMPVKKALDYSRNIPAIKMFYLAGWEDPIVKFVKSLGMTTVKENAGYGAPMAVWTPNVRPIDLLQAYSVFANEWIKRDIYAIDSIEDANGNLLEEHSQPKDTPVLSPAVAYIVTSILDDPDAKPDGFWRNALTIAGRKVAAKTGTSNKELKDKHGDKYILPRDLWTAGYSKQITTVVWAGNVDGHETKWTCDGLNCAAGIWKPFMEFANKDLPKEDWKAPDGVFTYTISKTSGKLASDSTPDSQKVSTIMAVKLTDYDGGYKDQSVDTLCNGPVSENTPPDSIGHILIPTAKPVIDGYDPAWTAWFFASIGSANLASSGSVMSTTPCERPGVTGNLNINIQLVGVNANTDTSWKKIIAASWTWDRPIAKLTIKYQDTVLLENTYGSGGKINGSERIATNLPVGDDVITVDAVDIYGFRYNQSKSILIGEWAPNIDPTQNNNSQRTPPVITMTNPHWNDSQINLYSWDAFNLRFWVKISTTDREITILLDGSVVQNVTTGDVFVFPVNTNGLSSWVHNLTVQVTDGNFQVTKKNITMNVLPR